MRFDGCHHLVQPYKRRVRLSTLDIITTPKEDLIEQGYYITEKKDLFYNEWAKIYFPFESKGRKPIPAFYKPLYEELKKTYYVLLLEEKIKETELKELLKDRIFNDEKLKKIYAFDDEYEHNIYVKMIDSFVDREKENLKARKRKFKVKALNNDWNYFVTFTYDDKKHTEETFLKALKKKLQNLHTNYGWLYMGCFERSKTDRLHFHGLLYVPEGKMRGNIREEEYYDVTAHRKAVSFINEEFEDKLGRNDFKPITKLDLTFTHALDYIIKYIGKSDNKIVYSRGIKDDTFCLMDYEDNIICSLGEHSPYYVCKDSSIIELTKDLDIDFKAI